MKTYEKTKIEMILNEPILCNDNFAKIFKKYELIEKNKNNNNDKNDLILNSNSSKKNIQNNEIYVSFDKNKNKKNEFSKKTEDLSPIPISSSESQKNKLNLNSNFSKDNLIPSFPLNNAMSPILNIINNKENNLNDFITQIPTKQINSNINNTNNSFNNDSFNNKKNLNINDNDMGMSNEQPMKIVASAHLRPLSNSSIEDIIEDNSNIYNNNNTFKDKDFNLDNNIIKNYAPTNVQKILDIDLTNILNGKNLNLMVKQINELNEIYNEIQNSPIKEIDTNIKNNKNNLIYTIEEDTDEYNYEQDSQNISKKNSKLISSLSLNKNKTSMNHIFFDNNNSNINKPTLIKKFNNDSNKNIEVKDEIFIAPLNHNNEKDEAKNKVEENDNNNDIKNLDFNEYFKSEPNKMNSIEKKINNKSNNNDILPVNLEKPGVDENLNINNNKEKDKEELLFKNIIKKENNNDNLNEDESKDKISKLFKEPYNTFSFKNKNPEDNNLSEKKDSSNSNKITSLNSKEEPNEIIITFDKNNNGLNLNKNEPKENNINNNKIIDDFKEKEKLINQDESNNNLDINKNDQFSIFKLDTPTKFGDNNNSKENNDNLNNINNNINISNDNCDEKKNDYNNNIIVNNNDEKYNLLNNDNNNINKIDDNIENNCTIKDNKKEEKELNNKINNNNDLNKEEEIINNDEPKIVTEEIKENKEDNNNINNNNNINDNVNDIKIIESININNNIIKKENPVQNELNEIKNEQKEEDNKVNFEEEMILNTSENKNINYNEFISSPEVTSSFRAKKFNNDINNNKIKSNLFKNKIKIITPEKVKNLNKLYPEFDVEINGTNVDNNFLKYFVKDNDVIIFQNNANIKNNIYRIKLEDYFYILNKIREKKIFINDPFIKQLINKTVFHKNKIMKEHNLDFNEDTYQKYEFNKEDLDPIFSAFKSKIKEFKNYYDDMNKKNKTIYNYNQLKDDLKDIYKDLIRYGNKVYENSIENKIYCYQKIIDYLKQSKNKDIQKTKFNKLIKKAISLGVFLVPLSLLIVFLFNSSK